MANFRIIYNADIWDAGTVTESTDRASRRGPNILLNHPGKKWVTTSNANQWVVNDLGSANTFTCFGLFGHNLTSSAVVKLQANASDSWGAPSVDITLTLATDADSVVFPRIVYFPSAALYVEVE